MLGVRYMIESMAVTKSRFTPKPRKEIWASDIGMPFIDRFLEMTGVPYSNPNTGKDIQNFEIGKSVELGMISLMKACAIPIEQQRACRVEEPNLLPVSGKCDIFIPQTSFEVLRAGVEGAVQLERPENHEDIRRRMSLVIDEWQQRSPNGLEPQVIEVKTFHYGAMKFRMRNGIMEPYEHHKLQLYTYMKALGLNQGTLLYVAKDLGKKYSHIEECVIQRSDALEALWHKDIETMTGYIQRNERPPLEPTKIDGKANWKISYSKYRDLLYGEGVKTDEEQI